MRLWAYYEATETVTVSIPVPQRECQIIDYDSRSTMADISDGGSNPPRSTLVSTVEEVEETTETKEIKHPEYGIGYYLVSTDDLETLINPFEK